MQKHLYIFKKDNIELLEEFRTHGTYCQWVQNYAPCIMKYGKTYEM